MTSVENLKRKQQEFASKSACNGLFSKVTFALSIVDTAMAYEYVSHTPILGHELTLGNGVADTFAAVIYGIVASAFGIAAYNFNIGRKINEANLQSVSNLLQQEELQQTSSDKTK